MADDLLLVKPTRSGCGVFAGRDFAAGQIIIPFRGQLFSRGQLPDPYEQAEDHYVQIGADLYLGPSGKIDDLFNHSCDPNSGLKISGREIILIAIKEIRAGEEIVWDYSTTMAEDDWEMDCACGNLLCRGRVRDFKYLPVATKEKYTALGVVPDYLISSKLPGAKFASP